MDTLETVSTVLALWPKSFQPPEKWRSMLLDEFENWSDADREKAIERVKSTHNGKRVSIETFRSAKNPERMAKLQVRKSMLRLNPTWAEFLDTLHPTHEHCFFSSAVMGEFAHELQNINGDFSRAFIRKNWGDTLKQMFGRPIVFVGEAISRRGPEREIPPDLTEWFTRIRAKYRQDGSSLGFDACEVWRDPEYQQYLKEFTARTGMQPG